MKRIGTLIPATNYTVEEEIAALYENKVINCNQISFHVSRIGFKTRYSEDKTKFLSELANNYENALSLLKTLKIDDHAFFCTSSAILNKKKFQGKKIIETGSALIEACRYLFVKKCLLITPYDNEVGKKVKNALENNGVLVKKDIHLHLEHSIDYINFGHHDLESLILKEYCDSFGNIVVSCTNLPTIHCIKKVESITSSNMISSNQAMFWKIFLNNSIKFNTNYMGKLFL